MKSIAKDQPVFTSELDESFENLLDYYELQDEAEIFVYYTNVLHNPQGFVEQVKKNEEWMTKMYDQRKDYFIEMVQEAMRDREQNAILNSLANRNVFLDSDQFRKFMKDGVEPEEFFDNTTKQVIPKDTERYNQYLNLLKKARALSQEEFVKDVSEESSLQNKIDRINKRRQEELGYLKGEEVEELVKEIIPPGRRPSFSIMRIMKESSPGTKIVAEVAQSNEILEFTNVDGVLYDQEGNAIDADSERKLKKKYPKFTNASVYATSIKVDQKQIDTINKKFDTAIADIVENFAKYQKEDTQDYMSNPTREKLKSLDRDLYNEIEELYKAEYGKQEAELEDQIQKDNLFNSFVKENKKARGLIEKFFNKVDDAAEVKEEVKEEVKVEKPGEKVEIESEEEVVETAPPALKGEAREKFFENTRDAKIRELEKTIKILEGETQSKEKNLKN